MNVNYYIRGLWDKRILIDKMRFYSAHQIMDITQEIHAVSGQLQIMSLQSDTTYTKALFARLNDIVHYHELSQSDQKAFHQGMAWYWMAHHDFDLAEYYWNKVLHDLEPSSIADFTTVQNIRSKG